MKININLNNNAIKLFYKLINELFYFDNFEKKMRLYISTTILKYEIFKLIHDEIKYFNYTRIHEKLIRDIYIFNIFIKFHKYLRYCSYCQLC